MRGRPERATTEEMDADLPFDLKLTEKYLKDGVVFFRFEGPVTEDRTKQLYRKFRRQGRGEDAKDIPFDVYRLATPEDEGRRDSVAILEPETFEFVRLVPIKE